MSERRRDVNPFEDGSAVQALHELPAFEEALARLLHTAEHARPFGIVRGPAGTGKSHLLTCVGRQMRASAMIDLRRSSADEFVEQLGEQIGVGLTTAAHGWRHIEDSLLGRAHASRPTLLLLDHLESVGPELARQVERLLALAENSSGWCTVLAAGRTLSAEVEAIVRRYGELRIELAAFELDETARFLEHVVRHSGCAAFTPEAAAAVHDVSGGLLREILRLGRLSLFAVTTEKARQVSDEIVWMVAGELIPTRPSALPHRRPPEISSPAISSPPHEALTADS